MRKLALVLMLALIGSAFGPLRAQSAPANAVPIIFGHSVVALDGPWKFHIGDNPQWADPNFDDSQWETVDLTPRPGVADPFTRNPKYVPGWTMQGHPGYWGYA